MRTGRYTIDAIRIRLAGPDAGCHGGDPHLAYQYVLKAGGLEINNAYPFTDAGPDAQSCNTEGEARKPLFVRHRPSHRVRVALTYSARGPHWLQCKGCRFNSSRIAASIKGYENVTQVWIPSSLVRMSVACVCASERVCVRISGGSLQPEPFHQHVGALSYALGARRSFACARRLGTLEPSCVCRPTLLAATRGMRRRWRRPWRATVRCLSASTGTR